MVGLALLGPPYKVGLALLGPPYQGKTMSTDDKFGIGAGLMALGLAAGAILLAQLTYDKDAQAALDKAAAAASDSSNPLPDDAPVAKPSIFYRLYPHRELVVPEAIFDGIVCVLALPAGIYFFVLGTLSGSKDQESDQ